MTKEKLFRLEHPVIGIVNCLIVLILLIGQIACNGQKPQNDPKLDRETVNPMSKSPLKFKINGEGSEVLVLLHGLGSNAKAWQKIIPFLEKDYKIYTIDLPKFLDIQDKSNVGISSYADLVHKFISELESGKAHIIGHSMGGQVAIKMALNHSEVVNSLTLLAPAGFEQFTEEDKTWFKTWVTKKYYLSLNDEAIAKSFDINFYGSRLPDDAQFMLDDRLALKTDSVEYSRYLDYVLKSVESMLQETVYDELSNIQVPTLVLFGSNDLLIPNKVLHPELKVEDIIKVSDEIPNAEKYLIEEAGHFIQWDKPREVASQLSNFLNNKFTNE